MIAFLRNPGRPCVFVMQVTEADLQQSGAETLPQLVQSWNGVIASLGGALTHSLVFWINVSYDDSSSRITWQGLPALRRLEPLTDGHIQAWLNRKEVQTHAAGRTTEILRLTEDPRLFVRRGQIRMQPFADAVNALCRDRQPTRNP